MDKLIELLIKSLPFDQIKESLLSMAKDLVENTESPVDDHFVKVLARLFDVDYDGL